MGVGGGGGRLAEVWHRVELHGSRDITYCYFFIPGNLQTTRSGVSGWGGRQQGGLGRHWWAVGERWVGARGRRVSLPGCLAWRGRGSLRGHLRLLHKHTQTIPEDVRQTWSTYAKTVTLGTRALFPSFFHSLGNTRRQQRHDCRFRCQVRHLSTSDSLGDMSLGRRRVRGHIHTLLSSISRLWDMLCCTG